MPAQILEQLAALRSEVGEVVYRTHPARLRMLELRARATERFLAAPDAEPELIEAKLRSLAADWWRAAADIAQPPGGSPRLAIPGAVTRTFSPVVSSLDLVAVGAESVTVRFRIEPGGGDAWTGPDLTVATRIEGEIWRARDALPQGAIPYPSSDGTWERLVCLECDPDLLRRQAVLPLKLRFEVRPQALAVPAVARALNRRVGDASVLEWRVAGPIPAASGADELLAEAMAGAPFEKSTTEEGASQRWRQVRAAAPGRLDADPFLVDLPESAAGAGRRDAVAVAAIDMPKEEEVELEILATDEAAAWLGARPLPLRAASPPEGSRIRLNRWRVTSRFTGGRNLLVVRCSAPPGAHAPWHMGARVRDAAGDPIPLSTWEGQVSSAAGSPERSTP